MCLCRSFGGRCKTVIKTAAKQKRRESRQRWEGVKKRALKTRREKEHSKQTNEEHKRKLTENQSEKYREDWRRGAGGEEGGKQEAPDGRFALPGRVAEEVIKQPFHLRLLG